MDNGALVFLIIIEGIIIVWLASKLKHYERFEKLLDGAGTRQSTTQASATSSASTQAGSTSETTSEVSTPTSAQSANAASRAIAGSVGSADSTEADLLDMPGVDPEGNIEEAKRVQLVMARCRYAEFYLEQLDDDYERGQFQKIVNSCKSTARNIEDPFFRASALHPVIVLLGKAEWDSERDELLAEVDDEFVRQQILEELDAVSIV